MKQNSQLITCEDIQGNLYEVDSSELKFRPAVYGIIIKDGKILSAGVLLPLTEDPKLSWKYGTRHRAAIGLSSLTDAVSVVISEETGGISISYEGRIIHVERKNLLKKIMQFYAGKSE